MRITETLEPYIHKYFIHTSALRVQCEYIIKIEVLIFPLIALSHRVCVKGPFSFNEGSNLKKHLPLMVGAFAPAHQASTSGFCFHLGAYVIALGLSCFGSHVIVVT